ncbi:hypothetical protein MMC25_006853 [Agyrium rufum]|nr:hypothetical protein [Agyrium rufum]
MIGSSEPVRGHSREREDSNPHSSSPKLGTLSDPDSIHIPKRRRMAGGSSGSMGHTYEDDYREGMSLSLPAAGFEGDSGIVHAQEVEMDENKFRGPEIQFEGYDQERREVPPPAAGNSDLYLIGEAVPGAVTDMDVEMRDEDRNVEVPEIQEPVESYAGNLEGEKDTITEREPVQSSTDNLQEERDMMTREEPEMTMADTEDEAHHIPPEMIEDTKSSQKESPQATLGELSQLIRKRDYELQGLRTLQAQVNGMLQRCAAFHRHICLQFHLYKMMLDQFRNENRTRFQVLYTESRNLRSNNQLITGPTTDYPGTIPGTTPLTGNATPSWITMVSSASRGAVLDLIRYLRNEPRFLADRLASLSPSQLAAISQGSLEAAMQSIVNTKNPSLSRTLTDWTRTRKGSEQESKHKIQDQDHSPLALLLHGVFDVTDGLACHESRSRTSVWSTACARIISQGKVGSNDFILSVLDSLVESSPWPSKLKLELFISQVVRDGAFILESTPYQAVEFTDKSIRDGARVAVAASEFFSKSLRNLLSLISKDGVLLLIPDGLLEFLHAVLAKIQDLDQRVKARNFLMTRWYCSTFLSKALMYPETYGMMMQHHLSTDIRHKILRELAVRFQNVVADVLSPWYAPPSHTDLNMSIARQSITVSFRRRVNLVGSEDIALVNSMVTAFDTHAPSMAPSSLPVDATTCHEHHLALNRPEILIIAKALFPTGPNEGSSSLSPNEQRVSIASTATESSTLTAGTIEGRAGTSSSMTPSFSWTSMTSATLLNQENQGPAGSAPGSRTVSDSHKNRGEGKKSDHASLSGRIYALIEELSAKGSGQDQDSLASALMKEFACFNVRGDYRNIRLFDVHDLDSAKPQESSRDLAVSRNDVDELSQYRRDVREGILQLCHSNAIGLLPTQDEQHSLGTSSPTDLKTSFSAMMETSTAAYDFQSSLYWWQCLQSLDAMTSGPQHSLLEELADSVRTELADVISHSITCRDWLFTLSSRYEMRTFALRHAEAYCDSLRDKMWYISDVCHSSTYEDARHVVRALRTMARSMPPRQSGVAAWARHRLKTSLGSERTQAQVLDAIAAPTSQGGPSKLSDSQAERTSKWLIDNSIENFCKGEERIHRYNLEVRRAANRLVGENLVKSPVLWSSSLYQWENQLYGGETRHVPLMHLGPYGNEVLGKATTVGPGQVSRSLTSPVNTLKQEPQSSGNLAGTSPRSTGFFGLHADTPSTISRPRATYDQTLAAVKFPGNTGPESAHVATVSSLPSSDTAANGSGRRTVEDSKGTFLSQLKQTTLSLLMSDLGYSLWNRGSETDRWISDDGLLGQLREAFGSGLAEAKSDLGEDKQPINSSIEGEGSVSSRRVFPFDSAYESILTRFNLSVNPWIKLQLLYELTVLVSRSHFTSSISTALHNEKSVTHEITRKPRTKTTRLEEVIANCEERRNSITTTEQRQKPFNITNTISANTALSVPQPNFDLLPALKKIFSNPKFRPNTLFRDLQSIASMVPTKHLDNTSQGKAFWSIGLAALTLKADLCAAMVRRADEIVNAHFGKSSQRQPTTARSTQTTTSTHTSSNTVADNLTPQDTPLPPLSTAARMYTIAALEGDPTAARELALFYLVHPDTMTATVTLPLSRPSDVFRSMGADGHGYGHGHGHHTSTSSQWSGLAGSGGLSSATGQDNCNGGPGSGSLGGETSHMSEAGIAGIGISSTVAGTGTGTGTVTGAGHAAGSRLEERERALDPRVFAVAFHWMEVAANGGDRDAVQFLRDNGEFQGGRS